MDKASRLEEKIVIPCRKRGSYQIVIPPGCLCLCVYSHHSTLTFSNKKETHAYDVSMSPNGGPKNRQSPTRWSPHLQRLSLPPSSHSILKTHTYIYMITIIFQNIVNHLTSFCSCFSPFHVKLSPFYFIFSLSFL